MSRIVSLLVMIALTCSCATSFAEECSKARYDELTRQAKHADSERQWGTVVESNRALLTECRSLVGETDLVKVYDSLSVGLLMQEQFTQAIDMAKKCIEQDRKYNACMMTAAKAYYNLGDVGMARDYAREAVEVGSYDDYAAAVVIYAKDFLKKLEKK